MINTLQSKRLVEIWHQVWNKDNKQFLTISNQFSVYRLKHVIVICDERQDENVYYLYNGYNMMPDRWLTTKIEWACYYNLFIYFILHIYYILIHSFIGKNHTIHYLLLDLSLSHQNWILYRWLKIYKEVLFHQNLKHHNNIIVSKFNRRVSRNTMVFDFPTQNNTYHELKWPTELGIWTRHSSCPM